MDTQESFYRYAARPSDHHEPYLNPSSTNDKGSPANLVITTVPWDLIGRPIGPLRRSLELGTTSKDGLSVAIASCTVIDRARLTFTEGPAPSTFEPETDVVQIPLRVDAAGPLYAVDCLFSKQVMDQVTDTSGGWYPGGESDNPVLSRLVNEVRPGNYRLTVVAARMYSKRPVELLDVFLEPTPGLGDGVNVLSPTPSAFAKSLLPYGPGDPEPPYDVILESIQLNGAALEDVDERSFAGWGGVWEENHNWRGPALGDGLVTYDPLVPHFARISTAAFGPVPVKVDVVDEPKTIPEDLPATHDATVFYIEVTDSGLLVANIDGSPGEYFVDLEPGLWGCLVIDEFPDSAARISPRKEAPGRERLVLTFWPASEPVTTAWEEWALKGEPSDFPGTHVWNSTNGMSNKHMDHDREVFRRLLRDGVINTEGEDILSDEDQMDYVNRKSAEVEYRPEIRPEGEPPEFTDDSWSEKAFGFDGDGVPYAETSMIDFDTGIVTNKRWTKSREGDWVLEREWQTSLTNPEPEPAEIVSELGKSPMLRFRGELFPLRLPPDFTGYLPRKLTDRDFEFESVDDDAIGAVLVWPPQGGSSDS